MKKLAIIGASYLQMPIVLKAKQMGIQTHVFAWEDGAVCKDFSDFFYPISILEKDLILEKCLSIGIDGITTIATDMAVPTISYVADKLSLVANSLECALAATNKGLMRKTFESRGVKSPRFIEVTNFTKGDFKDFSFPVIVKPVDRSGSRGVTKVNSVAELESAIIEACSVAFSKKCVIEEFIEGDEVSVESISCEGKHYILAVTDKVTTGEPYFVELAHHQPSELPAAILQCIEDETIKSLNALDVKFGASHSEFKITESGEIFVIEVGARMGGDFIGSHLVELSTGYDFVEAVINLALGKFEVPELKKKSQCAGVYFLSKETERLLPYFDNPNDFDIEKEVQHEELISITNSNDRSGYLIYQSTKKVIL